MSALKLSEVIETASDCLKDRSLIGSETKMASEKSDLMLRTILDIAKCAHPFVFTHGLEAILQASADRMNRGCAEFPPLPFSTCSFEFQGDAGFCINSPGYGTLKVACLIVQRMDPSDYMYVTYGEIPGRPELGGVLSAFNPGKNPSSWAKLTNHLAAAVEFIEQHETELKPSFCRLKVRDPKTREKQIIKIRDVIYVGSRPKLLEVPAHAARHEPHKGFSHRWEQRGHWRKCGGLGKDPSGSRSIEGRTWVREQIKGPSDKPVLMKVRKV